MKEKWMKFCASLGILKIETSADGVFMSENDFDKMAAIHAENETLKTDLQTAKDATATAAQAKTDLETAHATAIQAKDTEIAGVKTELLASQTALAEKEVALNKALGKETVAADAADPKTLTPGAKPKLTANQKAAAKNAAALFGGDPGDEDEEEENETAK